MPPTSRRTARSRALPCWIALLALTPTAPGQDAPAAKPSEEARDAGQSKDGKGKWTPVFQRHAADYRIASGPGAEAKMLPDPVLRWGQPIRGGDDGALYLWTSQGRPVAAVTFFTFKWPSNGERIIVHERHSFAPGPLEVSWRGRSPWHPVAPGLTFKPMPDAPAPADSAPARLRQMQAMIREVSATTTDDKGSTWTMRALNKPLHRYEVPDQGIADGALFALAQGTDPEVFFLLEARGVGKEARWEFAVARFTDLAFRVESKGRKVFDGPHTLGADGQVYFVNTVQSKVSESPDDFP